MKKTIPSALVAASGLAAVILGLGSPAAAVHGADAQIGVDHLDWLDTLQPKVDVPNVDTSVRHREIVLPLPS